jgi:hypothetical protein
VRCLPLNGLPCGDGALSTRTGHSQTTHSAIVLGARVTPSRKHRNATAAQARRRRTFPSRRSKFGPTFVPSRRLFVPHPGSPVRFLSRTCSDKLATRSPCQEI